MDNENLIISLIQQDLKHNQLIGGLTHIGLDSNGLHYLDILDIVCGLMKVPEGDLEDKWGEIYVRYMNESVKYEITHTGESLRVLAEACYRELRELGR